MIQFSKASSQSFSIIMDQKFNLQNVYQIEFTFVDPIIGIQVEDSEEALHLENFSSRGGPETFSLTGKLLINLIF